MYQVLLGMKYTKGDILKYIEILNTLTLFANLSKLFYLSVERIKSKNGKAVV